MIVVVEGGIGAGKTTLAKVLAAQCAGRPLLEETKRHPFIADFYLDPVRYAFQTEMNFILIHYHQLQRARKEGLFEQLVFSDFVFDKDRLFADLTLKDPEEQQLFTLTYDFLKGRVPRPDVLICLKAPSQFLFDRIRQRARGFEAPMSFEYLDSVNARYSEFFDAYDRGDKIVLNALDLHVTEGGPTLEDIVAAKVVPLLDPIITRPPTT